MDHEIDNEKPSSKEGGQVKVGDKVWVLCEIREALPGGFHVKGCSGGAPFWALAEDCRPVEPDHHDHPVEFKVGDRVVSWSGRQGVVEAINEIEGFPITVRHSMREQVSYKLGGVKHDDHPVEQAPKETTPKEPTPGQKLAERTMKAIWAANNAVNGTPAIKEPLATKSNSPEIPDSSSDPINPSHYKQGGIECIEAMKVALGGGFFGYLRGNAIKYLWRYDKKNGVEDLKKARWYLDRLIKEVGE
jgi:hypothetical protein